MSQLGAFLAQQRKLAEEQIMIDSAFSSPGISGARFQRTYNAPRRTAAGDYAWRSRGS